MNTKCDSTSKPPMTKREKAILCVKMVSLVAFSVFVISMVSEPLSEVLLDKPSVNDLSPETQAELDSILDLARTDYPTSYFDV